MEYEKRREIEIKIIEVTRWWCGENGLEASPAMEAELAQEIFRQVIDGKLEPVE